MLGANLGSLLYDVSVMLVHVFHILVPRAGFGPDCISSWLSLTFYFAETI